MLFDIVVGSSPVWVGVIVGLLVWLTERRFNGPVA